MPESEIEMVPVVSSNLAAAGYSADDRVLHVQFKSGATYAYDGVGQETFDDLLAAGSPGNYFATWIKGRYSDRRIN